MPASHRATFSERSLKKSVDSTPEEFWRRTTIISNLSESIFSNQRKEEKCATLADGDS